MLNMYVRMSACLLILTAMNGLEFLEWRNSLDGQTQRMQLRPSSVSGR